MTNFPKEAIPTDIEIQLNSTTDPTLPKNGLESEAEVMYNPDKIPPDFSLAISHGKAYKIHKQTVYENPQENVCPCCKFPPKAQKLSLMCSLKSLYTMGNYYLGSGYVLYFKFLKYCLILLALLFAFSGMFNLLTNINTGDCVSNENSPGFCIKDYITVMTIANKKDLAVSLRAQLYLNLGTVLIIITFLHYMRYKMRKTVKEINDKTTNPSDYALKLTRIPENFTNSDIKAWFEGFSSQKTPIKVVKIVRTYNIKSINQLEADKKALIKKYQKQSGHVQQALFQIELMKLQGEINKQLKRNDYQHTPAVYVIFEKTTMVKELLRMLKSPEMLTLMNHMNPCFKQLLTMNNHKINLKRAPAPNDVQWQNLGHSAKSKRKSRIVTNITTLIMLIGGFCLIMSIYWGQQRLKEVYGDHTNLPRILAVLGSILICIINTILSMTVKKLVEYEKHGTQTGYVTAVAKKEIIALLINTAFTNLIVELILSEIFNSEESFLTSFHRLSLYRKGGLVENMFFVFIMNSLYSPIFNIFNPFYFMQKLKQRQALKNKNRVIMTQQTANQLFEGPQPNISHKYAFVMKTILLTSFYAPGMPIVALFSLVGLTFTYWTDKYIFLRRNAIPHTLTDSLNDSMIEYLDWMVVAFSLGNIFFMANLVSADGEIIYKTEYKAITIVTLVIALIHILLPTGVINSRLLKVKSESVKTKTYHEARLNFYTDYDLENPLTRHQALDELIGQFYKENRNGSKKDSRSRIGISSSVLSNLLAKMSFISSGQVSLE